MCCDINGGHFHDKIYSDDNCDDDDNGDNDDNGNDDDKGDAGIISLRCTLFQILLWNGQ